MIRAIEERPRTANEGAFLFLSIIGGMRRRGQADQADSLAQLLKEVASSQRPTLEAREIAVAARAWADAYVENPAFAARLTRQVLDGTSGNMQARLDMPPPVQPQRRAAAPKPRAP